MSYNTRELTLKAIETLIEDTKHLSMQVVVWDNASTDGSADAIHAAFPTVELQRSPENLGFAAANNGAAKRARGDWLLLLNTDTEVLPGSIQNLLEFARNNYPEVGIFGGRTLFADGSVNATSCFNRMTVWSLFCNSIGLNNLLRDSALFDPERIAADRMKETRYVDVVTGCFFLIKRDLWETLGGFDRRYFMYAEEWDLCYRTANLGYKLMINPDATIIHHGGASAISSATKQLQSYRGKATIVRDHFGAFGKPVGLALLWLTAFTRHFAHRALFQLGRPKPNSANMWEEVWQQRSEWLKGY